MAPESDLGEPVVLYLHANSGLPIQPRNPGGCIDLALRYMRSEVANHVWDLTPVIDLIYALSSRDGPVVTHSASSSSTVAGTAEGDAGDGHGNHERLGNFDKLWNYLGQPLDTPPPVVEPICLALGRNPSDRAWCSPDEPESERTLAKVVRWRDELQGADLEDNDETGKSVTASGLSKRQKKTKRKQKTELAARQLQHTGYGALPIIRTTSDEESDTELQRLRRSPDRKAVIQEILYGTKPRGLDTTLDYSSTPPSLIYPPKYPPSLVNRDGWLISSSPQNIFNWQPQNPQFGPQRFLSAAAKKANLILKLLEKFPAEKEYISSTDVIQDIHMSSILVDSAIHVFVDVSNIMIGFHDSLKVSRGMPISARIPRVPFSFHNLSLVLERGRPTAKRVLVGSDKFPTIDEAKQIGYETNILDRVHKAKELTPRQKKYLNGNGTSGQSSGSETTALYAPQKWVEQAVDEILHLKMMESIVDVKKPSAMVLATGDAAEAEYSQGFLKMVERALEKGWKVELVSFKQNTSGAYKRGDFRSKWGDMFKIIELDDYTEELIAV